MCRERRYISARRNPYVQLILYPAQVQGEGAAGSIVRGIRMLENRKVDVIIVGRGGGSIEDLWAFNEEIVARAIFDCSVPVISAVGHETDTTIADYVADLRAPTPSAAAELAVWDYARVRAHMEESSLRLNRLMSGSIQISRMHLKEYQTRLTYLHPRNKLQEQQQRLAEAEDRLRNLMEQRLKEARHRLALDMEKMNGLSPIRKLNQGYSYVEKYDGNVIKDISQVKIGDRMSIYLKNGIIGAEVREIKEEQHG